MAMGDSPTKLVCWSGVPGSESIRCGGAVECCGEVAVAVPFPSPRADGYPVVSLGSETATTTTTTSAPDIEGLINRCPDRAALTTLPFVISIHHQEMSEKLQQALTLRDKLDSLMRRTVATQRKCEQLEHENKYLQEFVGNVVNSELIKK